MTNFSEDHERLADFFDAIRPPRDAQRAFNDFIDVYGLPSLLEFAARHTWVRLGESHESLAIELINALEVVGERYSDLTRDTAGHGEAAP